MRGNYGKALALGLTIGTASAWTEHFTMALPATPEWRNSSLFESPTLVVPKAPPEHVEATAYCACPICCGEWAVNMGLTASGSFAEEGRTIAADTRVFPFSTCLAIAGIGKRVVEDTGSAIKGAKIDIFFASHSDAKEFGRRMVEVTFC